MNQAARSTPNVAAAETNLRFPLTKKALAAAFSLLRPDDIRVSKAPGWHEASVDGAWSLTRLRAHFRSLGFCPVGHPDDLLFVNKTEDVGFQCHGVDPHPTRNTWKTYCVEVQARLRPRQSLDAPRGATSLF